MASLDSLPGDQRAVLQLVLGRGRSYEEIAGMLSINPLAVRDRAVAALDALGPQTKIDPEDRASVADYLLGQLPPTEIDGVRARLASSPGERAWARVISSELASLAGGPLPEIPVEADPAPAAPEPGVESDTTGVAPRVLAPLPPLPPSPLTGGTGERPTGEPRPGRLRRRPRAATPPPTAAAAQDRRAGEPRSSRLGGMVLIGLAVAVVVVVLVIVLASGGGSLKKRSVAATPTTSSTATASTTPTTSSSAKVIAQINLKPTPSGGRAAGIAEVLNEGRTNGIAIVAQNVTPNTTHPPNAYAVWLYNSPTDARILGFVNPAVGSAGRLSTAGALPSTAAHYKQLIVTVETSAAPKTPGQIILAGPLPSGV